MSRIDRRNWRWLPGRLRFRVLGLIDVAALWVLVAALLGAGGWWGMDTYRDYLNYCDANQELERTQEGECIGVTAEAHPFSKDLTDVMKLIEEENKTARASGKTTVSVAVMMPYTEEEPGAAMSADLIRHSLQGAYIAQRKHNYGKDTKDTAIQLLFANVGEDLNHWRSVTDELASRRTGENPVVAAIGLSNSDEETRDAVKKGLAPKEIPAVSAVLSSREMENPYLLKVSPSTKQLVKSLRKYVSTNKKVDRENTFMIADERNDNFVRNLSSVFIKEFGQGDGITNQNVEKYKGLKGPEEGAAQIFRKPVDSMCEASAKTVFLAGRDADLSAFLETIEGNQTCEPYRNPDPEPGDEPLRILRVSTGRDPVIETSRIREIAETYNIKIVTATAVDAPRWREGRNGAEPVPAAFAAFAEDYDREFVHSKGEKKDEALNDGYAVMHHDALTAVSTAVTTAVDSDIEPINHNVIYDQLRGGKPRKTKCKYCVPGAGGTFTFYDEHIGKAQRGDPAGLWPMCKPVPVVTFPEESDTESPLYRTHQEQKGVTCPPP